MSGWKTIDDLDRAGLLKGRRVIVRIDLNVPVRAGRVTDTTRIDGAAATIRELMGRGAGVVLVSHFGRPNGRPDPELSLKPVVNALTQALQHSVQFSDECIGWRAEEAVGRLRPGEVILLENTRFHAGEEANDREFVAQLARHGEAYVNDSFSCAHRAHASTEGLAHVLPAAAGRLMEAELNALESVLERPERPLLAVVGGAKVSTKLALLENLVARVDALVIGGGMANTFLAAAGEPVGRSLCEHDLAEVARSILARARAEGCRIHLPEDAVLARSLEQGTRCRIAPVAETLSEELILDAGPAAIDDIKAAIGQSATVVWNGPLGAFEVSPFDHGTIEAARHVARLTKKGRMVSVAGGGDTVAALNHAGVTADFTYVSTAGGAFLEWLEGKTLPGVAVLTKV